MTIQSNHWKSCVYALLSQTNPEILEDINLDISQENLVAANLIATNNLEQSEIEIENVEGQIHHFYLDLSSRIFQSKGNWMWINKLKVYFPTNLLLDVNIKPRVIDIPYTDNSNSVCAHWLFKHLRNDINNYFQVIYNSS